MLKEGARKLTWGVPEVSLRLAVRSEVPAEFIVAEIDRLMWEKGQQVGLEDRYFIYPAPNT